MTIETDIAALTATVDASYPDRSPGDAAHQQDHDRLHRIARALVDAGADQDELTTIVAALLAGTYAALAWNPLPIRKTVDETVNNDTATQADDELTFAIGANEIWQARFNLAVAGGSGAGSADFKGGVTVPAGATVTMGQIIGPATNASVTTVASQANRSFATVNVVGLIDSQTVMVELVVLITNGATAGNVTLAWAQSVATVADVTVTAGSHLLARRVA